MIAGFATYVQFLGTDHVYPDMKYRDRFVLEAQMYAFGPDAGESINAMLATCTNPSHDLTFGAIAYQKGASMIRMIEKFMLEENLKLGVQQYLKEHVYGNAESNDLWSALSQFYSGEDTVGEIMKGWTTQAGYPVVTYDGLTLSQERFFLNTEGTAFSLLSKNNLL